LVSLDPDEPNNVSVVPGIPVVIHGPKGVVPILGLIDSGADSMLMPMSIAASLGIAKAKCEKRPCLGAGGMGTQYVWRPGIEYVVQPMNNTRITSSRAAFADGLPSSIALLGREDFFRVFKVSIDERQQIFWLEKYSESSA
jgi:hypothetical protein